MGVCKTLLLDVMAPEVHQNDHTGMYVRSMDLPSIHYARILHGGQLPRGHKKQTHKVVKIGEWALLWYRARGHPLWSRAMYFRSWGYLHW